MELLSSAVYFVKRVRTAATTILEFLLLKYASTRLIRLVMFRRLACLSELPVPVVAEQQRFAGNSMEPLSKVFSGLSALRASSVSVSVKAAASYEVVEQLSAFSARGWLDNLEQKSTESHRAILSISRRKLFSLRKKTPKKIGNTKRDSAR